MPDTPHADPIEEGRRLVTRAGADGVTLRLLGGVAIRLQAPDAGPLLTRDIKDIDVVTPRGNNRALATVFSGLGYLGDEMFNAMHGTHRQLWVDPVNRRQVDVFVGAFEMCHSIPIAERLDREPLTVPRAELLLTKLQIIQLNERDERDIYNLCFHHDLDAIGAGYVAELCARDWGLWRTCRQTIERCVADVGGYALTPEQQELIAGRLDGLWERIEAEPKSGKWKRRSRVGDRKRWYEEPEEEASAV
ncbi:MAG TPA: hypothetical protein VHW96_04220 [Solirubrobacteraceae bacterium]|nr:hypothetical protein [Solirubrobacteraceae bacterium]